MPRPTFVISTTPACSFGSSTTCVRKLFSAPACPEGTDFRVAFRRQGEEVPMHTPSDACRANISKNVLVAGMRADSDYQMRAELVKGGSVRPGVAAL